MTTNIRTENVPAYQKRKFLGQDFQKLEQKTGQTDTQTDATEHNTTPHSRVV